MPYNPQTDYRGDEYLYKSLSGAGESIGKGISKGLQQAQKNHQEGAAADTVAAYLHSTHPDVMTEEMLTKFSSAGLSSKKALLGQMNIEMLNKLRTPQMQAETANLTERTRGLKQDNDSQGQINALFPAAKAIGTPDGVITAPSGMKYKPDGKGGWIKVSMNSGPMMNAADLGLSQPQQQPMMTAQNLNMLAYG